MRDAGQGMHKRRHAGEPPVVTRANHQIVALHAGGKGAAGSQVHVIRRVIGSGETGNNADVAVQVLIELSVEAVIALVFFVKDNRAPVKCGAAIFVERLRVIAGALVGIPAYELITGIVPVLCDCRRSADERHHEQEKKSGHPRILLVFTMQETSVYGYINTTKAKNFPDFLGD